MSKRKPKREAVRAVRGYAVCSPSGVMQYLEWSRDEAEHVLATNLAGVGRIERVRLMRESDYRRLLKQSKPRSKTR